MNDNEYQDKPASPAQKNALRELKQPVPAGLTSREANWRLKQLKTDWAQLPATANQEQYLAQLAMWTPGMRRGEASDLINRLKRHCQPDSLG